MVQYRALAIVAGSCASVVMPIHSAEDQATVPAPARAVLGVVPDRIDHYTYEVKHEVAWQSLGDDVRYETQQAWTMGLAYYGNEIVATVYSINAVHRGPGSEHRLQARQVTIVTAMQPPTPLCRTRCLDHSPPGWKSPSAFN